MADFFESHGFGSQSLLIVIRTWPANHAYHERLILLWEVINLFTESGEIQQTAKNFQIVVWQWARCLHRRRLHCLTRHTINCFSNPNLSLSRLKHLTVRCERSPRAYLHLVTWWPKRLWRQTHSKAAGSFRGYENLSMIG